MYLPLICSLVDNKKGPQTPAVGRTDLSSSHRMFNLFFKEISLNNSRFPQHSSGSLFGISLQHNERTDAAFSHIFLHRYEFRAGQLFYTGGNGERLGNMSNSSGFRLRF